MIATEQKSFTTEFGVDQKVEVVQLNFKGSQGYINKIIIDRNGIRYEVILTQIIHRSSNELKPTAIEYPEYYLKALEERKGKK